MVVALLFWGWVMGAKMWQPANGYEKIRAEELLKRLMCSSGGVDEVQAHLLQEMGGNAGEYFRVLTMTSQAFWANVWPKILGILEIKGVDHEALLQILSLNAQGASGGAK